MSILASLKLAELCAPCSRVAEFASLACDQLVVVVGAGAKRVLLPLPQIPLERARTVL